MSRSQYRDVHEDNDAVRITPDGGGIKLSFRVAVLMAGALITGTAAGVAGYTDIKHTLADHSKAVAALESNGQALNYKVDRLLLAYGIDPSKVVKDAAAKGQ